MGRLDGADRPVMQSWKRGWYSGVVVPEYETTGGDKSYVFKTEDKSTQKEGTRQIQLCVGLVNNGEVRNFNYSVYYEPGSLFDQQRVAEVLAEAKKPENKRGRWSDTNMQKDYMSFVALHEIEKALNDSKELLAADGGGLDINPLIGRTVDCFYSIYHKTEKNGKKVTDEVDLDTLKKYAAGETEWEKGWFGGIKYLDVAGAHTAKADKAKA